MEYQIFQNFRAYKLPFEFKWTSVFPSKWNEESILYQVVSKKFGFEVKHHAQHISSGFSIALETLS